MHSVALSGGPYLRNHAAAGDDCPTVSMLSLIPVNQARSRQKWQQLQEYRQFRPPRFRGASPLKSHLAGGVVQSFGFLVAELVKESGGAGSFAHMIHDEGPGTNCHGFASGGGEE